MIRQPIVTVAGHVDHGKTTILDYIRGTAFAAKEPGLITQKISFTFIPSELIEKKCHELLKKFNIKLEIPGFLFIDTPGHAAFTNLRKRGGSLADLAILVVDVNEGIMEQTRESIEILKANKLPFVVALTKIDKIAGWSKKSDDIVKNLESQSSFTITDFEKKLYSVITALSTFGFNSDLFFRIGDFTKQVALVPCSGKTGEGIPELLVMLGGLAQKFLKGKLLLSKEAKGTILEIKKEKGFTTIEAILYDGKLIESAILAIATINKIVEAKIRGLFKALPLKGFEPAKEVNAAAGVRLYLATEEELVPGMPFALLTGKKEEDEKIKNELQQEVAQVLSLDKKGIIVKAESLGSIEALLFLLRKEGISVRKAEIGNVKHDDLALALTLLDTDPLDACIVAFNVGTEEVDERIKIIQGNVIYRIIEQLIAWRSAKSLELEREKLAALTMPCRIKILPNTLFRQSKPAIFGVRVEAGTLKPGVLLMNAQGREIDRVKGMQSEGKGIEKAEQGKEIAISLPKVTFGRQIKENECLYSVLTEEEFKKLKENKGLLSQTEIECMREIAEIKRKAKPTWGI